jgi:hypothetical protein
MSAVDYVRAAASGGQPIKQLDRRLADIGPAELAERVPGDLNRRAVGKGDGHAVGRGPLQAFTALSQLPTYSSRPRSLKAR